MAFSPDGKQIMAAIGDSDSINFNELQVLDIGSASKRASIHPDTLPGQSAPQQLSPDGTVFALAKVVGVRLQVQLFKAATGEKMTASLDSQSGSRVSYFLADGHRLVYTDRSNIHILDLQSRTNTLSIKCVSDVYFFAVSPDEKTLAASHPDGTISLWDLRSGAQQGILAGHQAKVFSLAFSPDGRTLASGSEDRTLKLWHLAAQREVASFAQDQGVYGLTFSPDGQMLVFFNFGSYSFLRAPRDQAVIPSTIGKLSMADLPTNSIWRVPDGTDQTPSRMVTEQEQCFANMLKINAAILAYRKDHQQMPDWLSDLVPKYLSDTNCLICPVCARTGEKPHSYAMDDPKITTSYNYEFNAHLVTFYDEYGVLKPDDTMKTWKTRQMERYGPVVPVLRCGMHAHDLDITFAGEKRVDPVHMWDKAAEQALLLNDASGTNAWQLNYAAWDLAVAVSRSKQNPAQAVKLAERAVALEPKNGDYWNTLGVARYRNGEFQKAIAALEKSVELGNNPDTYYRATDFLFLAMAHHQLGDDDSARRDYSQASQWMRLHPTPNWEDYLFQTEAEHLLGPAITGQTEVEPPMPANSK